ncbi:hypothetical protein [Kamptonema sp. PCC 6506]|nr:hypothetical protein [Kamptonema sp. PCC 6506]
MLSKLGNDRDRPVPQGLKPLPQNLTPLQKTNEFNSPLPKELTFISGA